MEPATLFYSYSHKDQLLRADLDAHLALLKKQGLLSTWFDGEVLPGSEWRTEIEARLEKADIILLLVSADFLASDFCWGVELERAIQRHNSGEATLIPIILRPCDWLTAPFGRLQALPSDSKAVIQWEQKDEAWLTVAKGLRLVLEARSTRSVETGERSEISQLRSSVTLNTPEPESAADDSRANRDNPLDGEVAVLSVDVADHTEQLRKYGLDAKRVIEAYQQLVDDCLSHYGARYTGWAGDGGFGVFCGLRRGEQAVLAGIHMLQQIELLNLGQLVREMGEPLRIRVAAVAGSIEYRKPMSKMVELVISDADKLQKSTRAQELAIGDTIYQMLPSNIQDVFELIDRTANGQKVYVYRGVTRNRQPGSSEMKELLSHLETKVRAVRAECDKSRYTIVDASFLSELHGEVKKCYEYIVTFRRWCSRIDQNWAPTYVRYLLNTTLTLQRLETAVWACLMDWRQEVNFTSEAMQAYDFGFFSIAQDHGHEELALGELRALLSQVLNGSLDHSALDPSAGLSIHMERLAHVDEMERMAEFVALGRYDRSLICEYLRSQRDQELGRKIVHALWSIADLVVGEELKDGSQEPRADGLFGSLLTDPECRPRFQVLEHFLGDHLPDAEDIKRRFKRSGVEPTQEDLEVVWRAIVIAHPKQQIRYLAAERAPLPTLWQAVAYHGISLASLAVIAKRLNQQTSHQQNLDLKKIFFDCVKFRLERRIQDGDAGDLSQVADMVEGFYGSNFFVETPYFRALEALLALFESRVERFGGQVASLEAKLEAKVLQGRASAKEPGNTPAGVENLPPALKRHLAKDGCYVEKFACDSDERIAVEVARYLEGDVLVRLAWVLLEEENQLNSELIKRMSPEKLDRLWQEVERARDSLYRARVDPSAPSIRKIALGSQALLREVERKLGPLRNPKEGKSQGLEASTAPKAGGEKMLRCKAGHEYVASSGFRFCPIDGFKVQ